MPRIDQKYFQSVLLQNLKHRHPIHPGRLHGHAADSAVHQPVRHLFHIRGKTIEAPDGLLIPFRTDGHPMFAAANVDARCMGMHHFQRFPIYFRLIRAFALALSSLAHHFSHR